MTSNLSERINDWENVPGGFPGEGFLPDHVELWDHACPSRYDPRPHVGSTGMDRGLRVPSVPLGIQWGHRASDRMLCPSRSV